MCEAEHADESREHQRRGAECERCASGGPAAEAGEQDQRAPMRCHEGGPFRRGLAVARQVAHTVDHIHSQGAAEDEAEQSG